MSATKLLSLCLTSGALVFFSSRLAAQTTQTITSSPTGLVITVDSTTCTTPCNYSWTQGSSHTVVAAGPQTRPGDPAGTQYVYSSWSDGGTATHNITAPASATTYTASFTTQYQLTTAVSPSASGTIAPSTGAWYNSGTVVTITASAAGAYRFTNFAGDLSGGASPQNLTMSAPRSVTAYFGSASSNSYSSPGTFTWTAPAGVYSAVAQIWGGGGGGGAGSTDGSGNSYGGGGGGGGGYTLSTNISVIPGTSYTITIGGGGAGSSNAAGTAGTGSAALGYSANGGAGGGGGTPANQSGGAGGTGSTANGSTGGGSGTVYGSWYCFSYDPWDNCVDVEYVSAAGAGNGGASANGGTWAAGGSYCGIYYPGSPGNAPGGGGGGGGATYNWCYMGPYTGAGASGASGQVSISYAVTTAPLVTQTITSVPTGRLVTVDGAPCATLTPCQVQWNAGTTHTIAVATQAGVVGTNYVFTGWTDGGPATRSVSPSASTTYTANFTTQYQLTTASYPTIGGTITAPASGTWYNEGTTVTLSQTANSGFTFVSYTSTGGSVSGNVVTMSAPTTATANFTAPTVTHTITSNPTGLVITVDTNTCTTPCPYDWVPGTVHAVVAAGPQPVATGVQDVFVSWSDGGTAAHNVTAAFSPASWTATFTTQYQLTLAASPQPGGTTTPASTGWYNAGSSVVVSGNPNPRFSFTNFSGDLTGITSSQTLVMNGPKSVTANFGGANTVLLTAQSPVWTVPTNVYSVRVELWGGGGGGGQGWVWQAPSVSYGGGGGGGGGYTLIPSLSVSPGDTLGGLLGIGGGSDLPGTTTSLMVGSTTVATAPGGSPGVDGSAPVANSSGGPGGAGGAGATATGITGNTGGYGLFTQYCLDDACDTWTSYSWAAGGTGGSGANGGTGGASGVNGSWGLNGSVPGGGGGGGGAYSNPPGYGWAAGSGGVGAGGQILITWAAGTGPVITPSTTTLQGPASPSTYSPNVTLTATVAPTSVTGTITFLDGTVALGPPVSLTTQGATFNATTLGAGQHSLTASFSGTVSLAASTSAVLNLTVNQAPQTIAFSPSNMPLNYNVPVPIPATVSSGLALSFNSTTTNVCTISGTSMNLRAQGTCTITASQAGNANYLAATSITASFTVTPPGQTISFVVPGNPPGTVTLDRGTITLTATASSGLPVSFSATGACSVSVATVTLNAVGTCTITASQAGGGNFPPANPISVLLTIAPPLTFHTKVRYSNFGATNRTGSTATVMAVAVGGANPNGRVYAFGGTSQGVVAEYTMPAPTAGGTPLTITVADGESSVTKTVTILPSPTVSDDTVRAVIRSKVLTMAGFATRLGYSGASYPPFIKARIQSLTGLGDTTNTQILQDGAAFRARSIPLSQLDADLVPITAPALASGWAAMASGYYAEGCEDCCDPSDCSTTLQTVITLSGQASAPDVDPVKGLAWGSVTVWFNNPDTTDLTATATLTATAILAPSGDSNATQGDYVNTGILVAEASTTAEPTGPTTFTTYGNFGAKELEVCPAQGQSVLLCANAAGLGGDVEPKSTTWTPDVTPSITSVTVNPNPIQAGGQGTLVVSGANFGAAPTLQFSCAEDGTNSPVCSGSDLTATSLSYAPYPGTTSGTITATVLASLNAAGNYLVQVVSQGVTGLGFQAGQAGNSPASPPQPGVNVAGQGPPTITSVSQSFVAGELAQNVTVRGYNFGQGCPTATITGDGAGESPVFLPSAAYCTDSSVQGTVVINDRHAPGPGATLTFSWPGLTLATSAVMIVPVQIKLTQEGNTVISTDGKYSEDSTVRITAVRGDNGATITDFSDTINIAEDGTNAYGQNGGTLPASVPIGQGAGGTATFQVRSLAGPQSATEKAQDAKLKTTNYPVYQNDLGIVQWIVSGAVIDPHASGGVYDWVQARTRDIFGSATGDVATVLSTVSSYNVSYLAGAGGQTNWTVNSVTNTFTATPTSSITLNPYLNNYRVDSVDAPLCGINGTRAFTNTVLHEARHAYQSSQAALSNNDLDGDFLVKSIGVAPVSIVIDSTTSRQVCDSTDSTTEQRSFHGDAVLDSYQAPDFAIRAFQYDAVTFAASHDQ